MMFTLFCLISLLSYSSIQGQILTATISPEDELYNAPLDPDRMIQFNCSSRASIFQWRVNDADDTTTEVISRGVQIVTQQQGQSGIFLSILSIPARLENNNISIQCLAIDTSEFPVTTAESSLVILRIQGLLGPPPNLSLSTFDQLTRTLTWDAPETLDLTDIEPDIEFYQVCYNLSSDDLTCVNVSSSERREFIFPNVCVPLIFTVTAFNVVGEGNASQIVHNGSSTTCDQDVSISRHQVLFMQPGNHPTVTLSIIQNVRDSQLTCINIFKVQTTLNASSRANTTNHGLQFPEITLSEDPHTIELNLMVDCNLVANEIYSASVAVCREQFHDISVHVKFSTYDIQAVDISALPGGLELSCTFANGSQARSCTLTVCGVENEVIDEGSCVNITITRSAQALTSSTRHVVSLPGVYSIREVIEVESDGEMTTVRLIDPLPTTTKMGVPISGNIGAIIGACVAAAVLLIVIIFLVAAMCLICCKVKVNQDVSVIYDEPCFNLGTQGVMG